MKRMLLLLVSLLLISSVAMADHIGIYSDATGSSCYLGPAGAFNPTATIIQKFSSGATGSRFKASLPVGSNFFGFNTPYVPVGVLTSDLSLGYGTCLAGSIVLGTVIAIYGPGQVNIVPAETFPNIIYTNCSFGEFPATGGTGYVGSGECNDFAVEASTWGGVKALYR